MANTNTSFRVTNIPGAAQVFTSAAAVVTYDGTNKALLKLPAGVMSNKALFLRAIVEVTAITGNLTIEIRKGLLASDTVVLTSGAITTPGVGSAVLEFEGTVMSADDKLNGLKYGFAGAAPVLITQAISTGAVDPDIENTFNITLTFGTSGTARLIAFEVDVL